MDTISETFTDLVDKLQAWLEGVIITLPNLIIAAVAVVVFAFASGWIRRLVARVLLGFTKNR